MRLHVPKDVHVLSGSSEKSESVTCVQIGLSNTNPQPDVRGNVERSVP